MPGLESVKVKIRFGYTKCDCAVTHASYLEASSIKKQPEHQHIPVFHTSQTLFLRKFDIMKNPIHFSNFLEGHYLNTPKLSAQMN